MHLTDAQIIAGLKACKKLDVYSLTDHQIAMVFRKAVEMSEIPPDPWKDAVLQACMMTESGFMEADPALSVRNLIQWHAQLATDVAAHPAPQARHVKGIQWEDGEPPIGSYGVDGAESGDAEREALIERLKAQSLAHRYEAEADSADLIDEAVAALHPTGKPDDICRSAIDIEPDAPNVNPPAPDLRPPVPPRPPGKQPWWHSPGY